MQSRQEQLSDMQSRMLKKTFGEIREIVRKYADERKIDVVLSGNQVVYSSKTLDITDAILKQMNIAAPASAAAPATATPATPAARAPEATNSPAILK